MSLKCKKKSLQVCIMVDAIMYIFELAHDENKFIYTLNVLILRISVQTCNISFI